MSILVDPRFDHLEHYGTKGMRWGHRKRQEVARGETSTTQSPEQQAAVNRRRMELRKAAAAKEGSGTGLPAKASGSAGSGEATESSEGEEKEEEEEKEGKGKAKASKAKPNKDLKKLKEAAKKNEARILELEQKLLAMEKKIVKDAKHAEREKSVRKIMEGGSSFSFVGSKQGAYQDAAASGVLGQMLKKERS